MDKDQIRLTKIYLRAQMRELLSEYLRLVEFHNRSLDVTSGGPAVFLGGLSPEREFSAPRTLPPVAIELVDEALLGAIEGIADFKELRRRFYQARAGRGKR